MTQHIALFGGSFDPPHLGHLAVIEDLLQQKCFDELWLVPVFHHPFAKPLTDYVHRLHMLRLIVQHVHNPTLKICEIEKELNATTSYFYNTLVALKQQHPTHHFHIVVGSDLKDSLSKWHKFAELEKLAAFHFIPRAGFEKSPYPQISSTEIRAHIRTAEGLTNQVLPSIKDYIAKHQLYS